MAHFQWKPKLPFSREYINSAIFIIASLLNIVINFFRKQYVPKGASYYFNSITLRTAKTLRILAILNTIGLKSKLLFARGSFPRKANGKSQKLIDCVPKPLKCTEVVSLRIHMLDPSALRKAKTPKTLLSFGLSECNRVQFTPQQIMWNVFSMVKQWI